MEIKTIRIEPHHHHSPVYISDVFLLENLLLQNSIFMSIRKSNFWLTNTLRQLFWRIRAEFKSHGNKKHFVIDGDRKMKNLFEKRSFRFLSDTNCSCRSTCVRFKYEKKANTSGELHFFSVRFCFLLLGNVMRKQSQFHSCVVNSLIFYFYIWIRRFGRV